MDWVDYREALGIGFSDHDKAELFATKILNHLNIIDDNIWTQIDANEYFSFCNMTGINFSQNQSPSFAYFNIVKILSSNSHSLKEFLAYYIAFINCQKDSSVKRYTKENYKNLLCNMLQESHIPYELNSDEDGYFVFPKGAKELDTALVSAPLEWLNDYPKSRGAFVKALREYSEASPTNSSDIADKFRKALETFFQEFFGGGRSLEKYVSDHTYEQYLSKRGVPNDLRDELKNTVTAYSKFINNNAKHHDKTQINVLEYLLYQTGNIIRLLITLKQEEEHHAD